MQVRSQCKWVCYRHGSCADWFGGTILATYGVNSPFWGLSKVKHHDDSSNVAIRPSSLRDLCSVQQPTGKAGGFSLRTCFHLLWILYPCTLFPICFVQDARRENPWLHQALFLVLFALAFVFVWVFSKGGGYLRVKDRGGGGHYFKWISFPRERIALSRLLVSCDYKTL